ncbi:hypothetical protein LCGC14_0852650 [marine sediment metagenome]|uniref:Uncharacterized protein n=1 Tax=marine sediment metagenome TaxID=412755 RepID=A0A0F9P9U3_9ZZZZ
MKPEFRIIKDLKKDYTRKERIGKVRYPRYKAELKLNDKKINFSEHDEGCGNLTYTETEFDEFVKIPKNRLEYGEDYTAQNGDLVILRYKILSKNRKILTSIQIIGNSKDKKERKVGVKIK